MSVRPRVFSQNRAPVTHVRVPETVFDRMSCGDIIRSILSDHTFDNMPDLFWRRMCERRGFEMQPKEYGYRTRFIRQCGGSAYAKSIDLRTPMQY